MFFLKCLAGSDVNKYPTEIDVEIEDGLLWSMSGQIVAPTETEILGWGKIDGPAVSVKCGSETLTIPIAEFERIGVDWRTISAVTQYEIDEFGLQSDGSYPEADWNEKE